MTYSVFYISAISSISKHWRLAWLTSVVLILGLIQFMYSIYPPNTIPLQPRPQHQIYIKSISNTHSAVLSSNGLTQAQKTSISRENDPISANQMAKHSQSVEVIPNKQGHHGYGVSHAWIGTVLAFSVLFKLVERFATGKTPSSNFFEVSSFAQENVLDTTSQRTVRSTMSGVFSMPHCLCQIAIKRQEAQKIAEQGLN